MDNLMDLFRHELKDLYDAEHLFRDALTEMAEHVTEPELKRGFEEHARQTEGQIERLEEIFAALDEEPERAECAGARGLVEEHDMFMEEEEPSEAVSNVFHISAALKAEHYEIVAYRSLVQLAKQLDLTEAVDLLGENLQEEERMMERLEALQQKPKPAMAAGGGSGKKR